MIALSAWLLFWSAITVEMYAEQPVPAAPPPPVAVKFLALFEHLRAAENQGAHGSPQHVSFQMSDREINEYMRYSLSVTPRPGLDSVNVKVFAHNYISTFTVVDFDAVERWKPGTIPSLLKPMLKGKKSMWVDYRFEIANSGTITFLVEQAHYQDIRLPAFLVAKIISIVAARQPERYDTAKPLPLPFGLRKVWTVDHVIHGEN